MTDDESIRLRCIEAATRFPNSDVNGQAAGAVKIAQVYERYVRGPRAEKKARPVAADALF